jgi:hypothetical protein
MAEPERRRRAGLFVAAVLVLGAAACSGDDEGGDATSTTAGVSTTAPTTSSTATTKPTTTSAASTTTTQPATTIAAPTSTATTTSIPSFGTAELADAVTVGWESGRRLEADLLRSPTLEGLEDRVAAFALPGSEYYQGVVDRVRELVADGHHFAPSDPSFDGATVEGVHFDGAPFTSALVTACEVSNDVLVNADGQPVDTGFGGQLNTYRERFRMALSDRGWVRESWPTEVLGEFKGQQTCPPE